VGHGLIVIDIQRDHATVVSADELTSGSGA
jgi:hypothetical protein